MTDKFLVPYPCWVVLHPSSLTKGGDGEWEFVLPIRYVMAKNDDGDVTLPVFTDTDLAARFRDATQGMSTVKIVSIANHEQFVGILETLRGTVHKVAFDPPQAIGIHRRVYPLEYTIKQVRLNEEL